MNAPLTSASFPRGAECDRSEAEVRAIRARRARLEASYREDGFSESYIAAHVTDELAEQLIANERAALDTFTSLFAGNGSL